MYIFVSQERAIAPFAPRWIHRWFSYFKFMQNLETRFNSVYEASYACARELTKNINWSYVIIIGIYNSKSVFFYFISWNFTNWEYNKLRFYKSVDYFIIWKQDWWKVLIKQAIFDSPKRIESLDILWLADF